MDRTHGDRTPAETEARHARVEWVEKPAGSADASESAEKHGRLVQARRSADRGYLERVFGVARASSPRRYTASRSITPAERIRAIRLATTHPTVTPHLAGRWDVLGCDEIWAKHLVASTRQAVRVHLFNYTTNRLYAVSVEDDVVSAVEARGIHEYSESPGEMALALELARAHPVLGPQVRDLVGTAILRISALPEDPSTKRRCMWLMFTDPDEPGRQMPTRHTALVDLSALAVVSHSACSAPEAAR